MTAALGGANAAVVVARAASAIVDDTKVKQMAGDIIQCLAATVLRRNRSSKLGGYGIRFIGLRAVLCYYLPYMHSTGVAWCVLFLFGL